MIKLGTKAETLERLIGKLKYSNVLPQIYFTEEEWKKDRKRVLDKISELDWFLNDRALIVRSSALNEDKVSKSLAGKYQSVPNVKGRNSFEFAVEKVIESYDDNCNENQILVQPMLKDIKISGVSFTIDPGTNGNYYVINYDDTSGLTDTITSGCYNLGKVIYCFKDKINLLSNPMDNLCKAFKEIEELFDKNNLDIEFVVMNNGKIFILQVRELYIPEGCCRIDEQRKTLLNIENKIKNCKNKNPFLFGRDTMFGQMPDWNISEVLGVYPKPLSLSIFCKIAAYTTWAKQRNLLGYKKVQGFPLLIDLNGIPYVNILNSFNSLIPSALSEELGNKLIDFYLNKLKSNREYHDKVEFEILYTCYTFETKIKIYELKKYNFTDEEIYILLTELKEITKNIILDKYGVIETCYNMLDTLKYRNQEILSSDMDDVEKVYWLLEDCKEYGIPAFVGLARVGFIASQLLKSMVDTKIISQEQYEEILKSIVTINKKMSFDFKEKSREEFLNEYGFLRPGTYDITLARYDENPDMYFNWNNEKKRMREVKTYNDDFELLSDVEIDRCMKELGILMHKEQFFAFIKRSIEGREISKFLFAKNISDALKIISNIGKKLGFTKEDCSYLDINIFEKLYVSCMNIYDLFDQSIKEGRKKFETEKSIRLPSLIINSDDLYCFKEDEILPNFITNKNTIGKIILIESNGNIQDLTDKILLIPYADPGYDWIFTHRIAGFITKFGGINSHMAIRAHELGIPCVLGVGEMRFNKYCNANVISIDAQNRKIQIIS